MQNTLLRVTYLILAIVAAPAWSATYWVGSSPACTGSNVHGTLNAALLAAVFNGSESDEIRLTNTITYAGGNGKVTLTDWSPSTVGNLTISGGYPDCFTSPSGRTNFGDTTGTSVTVETSSQSESNVTLRRLNIRSAATGLSATGGASVMLDNVRIGGHSVRGVSVDSGAYVLVNASSIVESNGSHPSGTGWGGGIHCNGTNSEVTISGRIYNNAAHTGGNVYIANNCFVMLMGGSVIDSKEHFGGGYAWFGGGVAVDNGGELYANGGNQLVHIRDNSAEMGGGIYVTGSGRATLLNTRLVNNTAAEGAAIYAINGGSASPQLVMDRKANCPFAISCSELEANYAFRSIVYVHNSHVRFSRTIFDANTIFASAEPKSLIHARYGANIRIGHVGFYRNITDNALWNSDGSQMEIQHATIARNTRHLGGGTYGPAGALLIQGSSDTYLRNSILADSTGVDLQGGSMQSECILADTDPGDVVPGTFYIGTPIFINIEGGDGRQTSESPGVDMCLANTLWWSSDRDIEYQTVPVNDANNDQGNPGQEGGYYDAGFDENHMNVGDDYFTLTAARLGGGTGSIISIPLGIACGSDCEEDYFNGTLVELHANAAEGSMFSGWSGCPLPSGNICYISVTENTTVTASFEVTEDALFDDRFEAAP